MTVQRPKRDVLNMLPDVFPLPTSYRIPDISLVPCVPIYTVRSRQDPVTG